MNDDLTFHDIVRAHVKLTKIPPPKKPLSYQPLTGWVFDADDNRIMWVTPTCLEQLQKDAEALHL